MRVIVFGRGLWVDSRGHYKMSRATKDRVIEACRYIRQAHRGSHEVIFTGGWGEYAHGVTEPELAEREAALMARYARNLLDGSHGSVRVYLERDSRSTLQNVVNVQEMGLLSSGDFSRECPLVVVSHRGHAHRIRYFLIRVARIPRRHMRFVYVSGPDYVSLKTPEFVMYLFTIMLFSFVRNPRSMVRLEQFIAALRLRAE